VYSTGVPQSDGVLINSVRIKIRYYRQIYVDRSSSCTSGRVYDDFTRLLLLDTHRETSILSGELPEESEQRIIRFFRTTHLENLKGSVGLTEETKVDRSCFGS
jgi:hypothetical protein